MTHDDLRKLVLIEASKIQGVRLFPNPNGLAVAGKVVKRFQDNGKSYVVIENPRQIKFGMGEGTGDLIGFKNEKFLSVELKVGRDTLRPEQKNWIEVVSKYGGIAGVVKDSVDGLYELLER
jgi:hypothetical protein